ncbi:hypothetical protein ILYODFUR_032327 [Ilyodon furcidens]|uniref:Ubiquitin-like protease family profile domain-containing protein n=1 Tax=Ilyodon furcidens TaxID=33524 RepID=A0ABV0UKW0_9TELE
MRKASLNRTDWLDVKLTGGVVSHPVQQDGSSCGVVVIKMATAVMEAFPDKPKMTFSTTKSDIVKDQVSFALQILESSAFDMDNNYAICSASRGQVSLTG